MAIWDIFKVNRKTFINPGSWLDFGAVKQSTNNLVELFRIAFNRNAPPVQIESFDEMMKRLNLSEEEVKNTSLNYLTYAIIFVLAGIVLIGFGVYLLMDHFFLGFLLSLGMCAVMLAQAFRFHFWYFQIKHRKLGCTFEEWRTGSLKDEGSA